MEASAQEARDAAVIDGTKDIAFGSVRRGLSETGELMY
jgi:hypothetical protein